MERGTGRGALRCTESGREQAAAWAVRSLSEIGLSEAGLRMGPREREERVGRKVDDGLGWVGWFGLGFSFPFSICHFTPIQTKQTN